MRRSLSVLAMMITASPLGAFTFDNIDGGTHDLTAWRGQPVLVVNTASLCGFTPQYEGLQRLSDTYAAQGLVVLAVPSDDFRQELGSAEEVKDFCELTFGLDLPMTDITPVKGADAHPFFAWMRDSHGFVPAWNFNKVLIGKDGEPIQTWGSSTRPDSPQMTRAIEAALAAD